MCPKIQIYILCVCVCNVYVCVVCTYMCTGAHTHAPKVHRPKDNVVLGSVLPLRLNSRRQGLSLNLQLGCESASPKDHVPAPMSFYITISVPPSSLCSTLPSPQPPHPLLRRVRPPLGCHQSLAYHLRKDQVAPT